MASRLVGEVMLYVNGSDIDEVELQEYWRMSRAYSVGRYERMLWTAERYSNIHYTVPSVRVFKALDRVLQVSTLESGGRQ